MFCLQCNKELSGDKRKKFCNHSCSASYNNSKREYSWGDAISDTLLKRNNNFKREKICIECGNKYETTLKTRRQFCSIKCSRKSTIRSTTLSHIDKMEKWYTGDESINPSIVSIRRFLIMKLGPNCMECNFAKKNPFHNQWIIQLHHVDGNKLNNKDCYVLIVMP